MCASNRTFGLTQINRVSDIQIKVKAEEEEGEERLKKNIAKSKVKSFFVFILLRILLNR